MSSSIEDHSPSWEVLELVAHHLEPKTLALASCVSKSWLTCFSSDHLWDPLCSAHFPSLSTVSAAASVPRRRLYYVGHTAADRRLKKPRRKPHLSLHRLLFTLSLRCNNNDVIINIIKPCGDVERDPHGLFRFDMEVVGPGDQREFTREELDGMRVTWNVVEREWRWVFTMAEECGGKGSFVSGVDGWFSEELPSPRCCSSSMSSGLVADIRLGLVGSGDGRSWPGAGGRSNNDHSKVRIEKVSVGVLSILNWRYVTLEDGLSYLEHFLDL